MKRSPESSERKKGIERMRPDHERLSFLTVNQAIESIKIMTGLSMNLEDLISQCEDGYCIAYLVGGSFSGFVQVAGSDEAAAAVYGAGAQRIVSIGRLMGLSLDAAATLVLAGPVFSDVPDDYEEAVRVWEAEVPRAVTSLRFKPIDIQKLAQSLVGSAPASRPLETRERESMAKLVAILVEVNGLDGMGDYKLAGLLLTEAARLGLSPLSVNTIVTPLRNGRQPRDV